MRNVLRMLAMAVVLLVCATAQGEMRRKIRWRKSDTVRVERKNAELPSVRSAMSMSSYPVKIEVRGRLLCIQSDHEQLLPIYNSAGTLYMAMRLRKGTNWLNGLPRGRYLINNQPVSVS